MKTLFRLLVCLLIPAVAFANTTREPEIFNESITVKGNIVRQATNGGSLNVKINTVTEAVDSGAGTQAITNLVPAGAFVIGLDYTVGTIIAGAGASTFDLGVSGGDTDLFGAAIAFAAGTTVTGVDYTAAPTSFPISSSAQSLLMTADAGQLDSGEITCNLYYVDVTAGS